MKTKIEVNKIIEVAEDLDWTVYDNGSGLEFSKSSNAGQDFNFYISLDLELDGAEFYEAFFNQVVEFYSNYDPSEEAMLWLDDEGHGVNGAPYEMIDVYKDMEDCKEMVGNLIFDLSK